MTPALPRNAEEFLSWLDVERGRSPRTLASYRRDLASYQAFVAQRGAGGVIDGATPAVVAAYVASLRRTRSGATVARSLSTLRGFHRFLVEEGEAAVDPTADIPGVGRGRPVAQGPQRGRDGPAARRGGGYRAGHARATGPCSSCSTAPGRGSARWSG